MYSGDTKGKWFDVKIKLDGTNKKAYYFVKDEDGNVYNQVLPMPWVNESDNSWYDNIPTNSDKGIYSISCTLSSNVENSSSEAVGEMQYFKLYEESQATSSIALTDANGNAKTSVAAGDTIKADYVIYPTFGGSANYDVYIALYSVDEDGTLTLESVKKKEENLYGTAEGSTEAITVPSDGKYAVKAMIWQNGSMRPLTEAVTAQ